MQIEKREEYRGRLCVDNFYRVVIQWDINTTLILPEVGACDNFRDNATMLRSWKIVACCVVANYAKIVALSLSRRKIDSLHVLCGGWCVVVVGGVWWWWAKKLSRAQLCILHDKSNHLNAGCGAAGINKCHQIWAIETTWQMFWG